MAAEASPVVRATLKLEYDESGRIIAFQEPMLVVRLEPADRAQTVLSKFIGEGLEQR
jgi:hypothetical protein